MSNARQTLSRDLLPEDERHRILITLLHPGYARNYEGALRLLLSRGHNICLLMLGANKQSSDRVAERLGEEFANLTIRQARKPEPNGWRNVRWAVRLMIDYARYLHPRYRDAEALRIRVASKMLGTRRSIGLVLAVLLTIFVKGPGRIKGAAYSNALVRGLLRVERALPTSKRVDDIVRSLEPDAVIASPYVAVGSREPDYLRSAKLLGIRTGVLVASWDNLTNKGLFKTVPDRVVVWNEAQRTEASTLHGVPPDHVVATGAQRFDGWFERRAHWDRRGFAELVGLPVDKPIVLYLCSSPFIAPDELPFVRKFVEAIRGSETSIRDASILIRPHPQNAKQWINAKLDDVDDVVVWPPAGEQPVDAISRAGFYDSIHHSAAVVGINTSAQIEAGIVGRTVHTVLDSQFSSTQEGTLHFHHLLAENGGLLYVANDLPELVGNLQSAIDGRLETGQTERFIESFVRPNGRDIAATPLFAEAIEDLCRIPAPDPAVPTIGDHLIRAALTPLSLMSMPHLWQRIRTRVRRAFTSQSETPPTRSPDQEAEYVAKRAIKPLARREGSIVVGPWLGDVSHEVLYWVPFLRWATQTHGLDSARLVAVSRGGARDLYANFCDQYVDVLDLVDPYLVGSHARRADGASPDAALKMTIVKAVAQGIDGPSHRVDPAIVRNLFGRFWAGRGALRGALRFLDMRTLRALEDSQLSAILPSDYIVCCFLHSPTLPETKQSVTWANALVDRLASTTNVVVLGPPPGSSGVPIPIETRPRVVRLIEDLDARRALHVQSHALANANGLVSSYGALNHLATSLGTSSVGLFSEVAAVNLAHVTVTERLAAVTGADFRLVHTNSVPLLDSMFGATRVSFSSHQPKGVP